jgi:hypothetical protein
MEDPAMGIYLKINPIKKFLNNFVPILGKQRYSTIIDYNNQECQGYLTASELQEKILIGLGRGEVSISENGKPPVLPNPTHMKSLEKGVMPNFS